MIPDLAVALIAYHFALVAGFQSGPGVVTPPYAAAVHGGYYTPLTQQAPQK